MGESTNSRAKLHFDRRIRLEFRGATITSDAGLLACRELDDALGLTETTNECLQESRGGRYVQHRLLGLLRQSVYPGFPILGVFRLKGQSKRDGSIIVRSCKASLSPVYPIRDAIPAVNHASCPSLSSSGPPPMG